VAARAQGAKGALSLPEADGPNGPRLPWQPTTKAPFRPPAFATVTPPPGRVSRHNSGAKCPICRYCRPGCRWLLGNRRKPGRGPPPRRATTEALTGRGRPRCRCPPCPPAGTARGRRQVRTRHLLLRRRTRRQSQSCALFLSLHRCCSRRGRGLSADVAGHRPPHRRQACSQGRDRATEPHLTLAGLLPWSLGCLLERRRFIRWCPCLHRRRR